MSCSCIAKLVSLVSITVSIFHQELFVIVGFRVGLAIRATRPDYANGFNTIPTRLLIGSKHVTRTRPDCEPGNSNTTRYTRLQKRSNSNNPIGSSTGKQENSKKNSHSAIMRNSPRKFLSKTITKIPSTHSVPQPKTRIKNPKNRPEQGYIFKLQQFNPMNPHGSIKTYQSKNTQNNINNGNTRITFEENPSRIQRRIAGQYFL